MVNIQSLPTLHRNEHIGVLLYLDYDVTPIPASCSTGDTNIALP